MDVYTPMLTLSNYAFMCVLLSTYRDNCNICYIFKSFTILATSGIVFTSILTFIEGIYMDYMEIIITFMSFMTTLGISICAVHNIRKSDIKFIFLIYVVGLIGLYFWNIRLVMLFLQMGGLLLVRHVEI